MWSRLGGTKRTRLLCNTKIIYNRLHTGMRLMMRTLMLIMLVKIIPHTGRIVSVQTTLTDCHTLHYPNSLAGVGSPVLCHRSLCAIDSHRGASSSRITTQFRILAHHPPPHSVQGMRWGVEQCARNHEFNPFFSTNSNSARWIVPKWIRPSANQPTTQADSQLAIHQRRTCGCRSTTEDDTLTIYRVSLWVSLIY